MSRTTSHSYHWIFVKQTLFVMRIIIASLSLLIATDLSAKNVLVVDSYHASYPWTEKCRRGLEEHLDPMHQVSYYEMDTKRIHQDDFAERAKSIWKEITEMKPDLVVTMDDNALKYLGQRVADAGFPLVFMGVTHNPRGYFINNRIPPNVTGILERPLLKQNIYIISRLLLTKNRRILLMMDDGVTSNKLIEHYLGGSKNITIDWMTLDAFTVDSYSAWQAKVKELSPQEYDALIISSYGSLRDHNNQQVPDKTVLEWTSSHSAIPMFTFWLYSTGKGKAIGGVVLSGYEQGASVAHAVNTILSTGKIPSFELPRHGELIFSESELSRWNIKLPDNISIRSRLIE